VDKESPLIWYLGKECIYGPKNLGIGNTGEGGLSHDMSDPKMGILAVSVVTSSRDLEALEIF
jgi:hypothetical protein